MRTMKEGMEEECSDRQRLEHDLLLSLSLPSFQTILRRRVRL